MSLSFSSPSRCLLGYHLTSIKLDQHSRICLQVFHWNGKSEIVEEQKLELKMVQFNKWQSADLLPPC